MPRPKKYRTTGVATIDSTFAARVQSPPGTDIAQSSISAITYTVEESVGLQAGTQTGSGILVIGSVVFNILQTSAIDPSWAQDNTGYNFRATLPGANFPDAGEYVVLFLITPTGGGSAFPIECLHHCNSMT